MRYNHLYTYLLLVVVVANLFRCATKPPKESGSFKKPDLVELIKLDSSIRLDIRYATANNLVWQPVYTEAKAFLQRPAAEALVNVSKTLKKEGFGLLVFDGYRPWSVTKRFWYITPAENKKFVADPKKVRDTIGGVL